MALYALDGNLKHADRLYSPSSSVLHIGISMLKDYCTTLQKKWMLHTKAFPESPCPSHLPKISQDCVFEMLSCVLLIHGDDVKKCMQMGGVEGRRIVYFCFLFFPKRGGLCAEEWMWEFLVLNKALLPSFFFFFPLHFLSSFVFISLFFFFHLYVGTFKTSLFLGGVTPILLGEPSSLLAPWLAQNFPQAHLLALLSACGCSIHLPAWEYPGQQHMKYLC